MGEENKKSDDSVEGLDEEAVNKLMEQEELLTNALGQIPKVLEQFQTMISGLTTMVASLKGETEETISEEKISGYLEEIDKIQGNIKDKSKALQK